MPSTAFLVSSHQSDELVFVMPGGQPRRQAVAIDHPAVRRHAVLVYAAQQQRRLCRVDQPDGDRFAMAQVVAAGRLQGVGQRVAVVQHHATSRLTLVGGHHLGFDSHRGGYAPIQRQPLEVLVAQEVVFGHLALPAEQFPLRQRVQHLGVAQHGVGLPEGAHQVLALGQVHAGLPADRCVHLRQQRGRNRHEADAPVVDGCCEACQVGDDSPADRDDRIGPGEPDPGHPAAQGTRLGTVS